MVREEVLGTTLYNRDFVFKSWAREKNVLSENDDDDDDDSCLLQSIASHNTAPNNFCSEGAWYLEIINNDDQ